MLRVRLSKVGVMDTIKALLSQMLTEREAIIYMLVESGMTTRDLAERLSVSHGTISLTHKNAQEKITLFGELGLYSTELTK